MLAALIALSACIGQVVNDPSGSAEDAGSPLCGLYCVYAAARTHGVEASFDSLADQKYVSTKQGSTSSDLQRALSDIGLHSELRRSMSLSQLCLARGPVILHVRAQVGPRADGYRHWVLFLGFDDDGARVYDPPRATDSIDPAELLSIWDGTGIIVTPQPSGGWAWIPPLEGLTALAVISCLLMALRGRGALTALVGTCLIAASIWLGFSICAGLVSRTAVTNTVGVNDERPMREIGWDEMRSGLGDGGVTIVDARRPPTFESGHIDSAVNIPVTSGYVRFRQAVRDIPKNRRIVVYCNNEKCAWSDSVADQLVARGYSIVAIFRGGYNEWLTRTRPSNE